MYLGDKCGDIARYVLQYLNLQHYPGNLDLPPNNFRSHSFSPRDHTHTPMSLLSQHKINYPAYRISLFLEQAAAPGRRALAAWAAG